MDCLPFTTQSVGNKKPMRKPNATQVRESMHIDNSVLQRCVSDYSFGKFKIRPGEVCVRSDKNEKHKKLRAVFLIHRPTGVSISGYLRPKGFNPGKKEISELRQAFITMYLPSLERLTRRYLRACMARQYGPIPKGQFDE